MRRACTTPLTPAQDDRGTPKSARARWRTCKLLRVSRQSANSPLYGGGRAAVDGVPFHIEGRRSLDDVLVRTRPPRGRSGQARRADRDGHSGRERTVMSEQDAFDRILASVHDARHCQLVVGSALLPREIDASIVLSRRTSPHPIQRTRECGADGGEPIAGGVDRLGTDSARYVNRREPLELSGRRETPPSGAHAVGSIDGRPPRGYSRTDRCSEAPMASPRARRPSSCAACR